MGSQKQVCGFILTWFLIIWCVCEAKVSLSSTNDNEEDKVNLSLYYESLCPYCASFIVNELVKVFKTDLISIVNLRLVPWGNTQISPNNTWICQHGIDECQLDVAEACAIRLWPSVETHFKFIYCIERLHLMNRHTEWQSCFGAAGFNPTALRNCYINGLGYQIEIEYADETARLNPPHRFVPWVLVNNQPLQEVRPYSISLLFHTRDKLAEAVNHNHLLV
ncbi:gamma-interferon-inducible lysosomal thiol reductase [Olea europaea subsp. europaea]|uniref:Gamma-interferon-inducible lysosomal thiol reductase n=1 Tax=Olea europaea subsp. europaea TaxID=158383 RepID=A0A8S0QV21_OLEEU|nr:gamma-interferon-inducible lysosomal thiol reductase [Olea europaea subsp. europaea]